MNGSRRKLDYCVLEDDDGCRSSEFLRLCEQLPNPGSARTRPRFKEVSEDKFMTTFNRLYAQLPGNFRGSPPDKGVEIVKTQLVLAALKNLISDLKAKP